MSHEDFIMLVKQMRERQTIYFKFRRKEDMWESQRLERKVDQAIQDFEEGGVLL